METQLLKLNPPYNIICYGGLVAKHVGTLIIIKEEEYESVEGGCQTIKHVVTESRPVVDYGDGSPEGDVWEQSVSDCRVVCRENESDDPLFISLAWFCQLLKFNMHLGIYGVTIDGNGYYLSPGTFYHLLRRFNIILSSLPSRKESIEVNLSFTQKKDENSVVIESTGGNLYFFAEANLIDDIILDEENVISDLVDWMIDYHSFMHSANQEANRIIFKTNNDIFKPFVERLNQAIKEDGEQK